jgi:signal transduction histidine kinase
MRSLRGRLVLAMVAAVLLSVAVSLSLGVTLTRDALRDSLAKDLAHEADTFKERLSELPRGISIRSGVAPAAPRGLRRALPGGGSMPVPPPGGGPPGAEFPAPGGPPPRPPADAPHVRLVSVAAAARLLPSGDASRLRARKDVDGRAKIDGRDQLYSARPLSRIAVVVTRPASLAAAGYGRYLTALLLASGLAGLVAAAIAAGLARRLAAPLGRIAGATRELAAGRAPGALPPERTTELESLRQAFEEMAAKLARAKEAERSLLLSVSHELRTPLTAIRGYAEGIEDGTVEPGTAAEVVGREATRLERLVQDLLDLARLEQGVLDVRSEPVDLLEAAREAEARSLPQAREHDVEIRLEGDEPAGALADHDRTVQVLSNLVENAVRATPVGGRVTIRAGQGRLSVADTGPGIPAEDLPRAFERFHLHRRRESASADGSGLGLAVVRELTEAMGGSVSVTSERGQGAVFTVILPAGR